ncbi:MAG: hypothetical protein KGZ53_04195 [Peptococcaceae bacterium]|nr:hypothetical protein [Peptococcaceae bacterium]
MIDKFFLYEELKDILYKYQADYPAMCRVEVIGHSYEGRGLLAVTVTNFDAGSPDDKPALYLEGNMHAGEVTSSMVCLYVLDFLLHNSHRSDIKHLLDYYTLYINPRVSPDGAEKYLTTPYTLRSSVRPYPDREVESGLVPEDIDENGLILQMRVKHLDGNWRISGLDPRLMVQRKPDEEGAEFYHVYPEGLVRGYDGGKVTLAKALWGLDFNRNYPANWVPEHLQKGAGPYPLSEPETRAVADYVMSHPNICVALSLHTTGEVALRPFSTADDSGLPRADLDLYGMVAVLAKKSAAYDLIPVFGGLNKGTPSHGDFKDWAYEHLGILSLTIELWEAQVAAGIMPRSWPDRQQFLESEWESKQMALLRWNDQAHGGQFFVNWERYTHPQLGEVEIGGWRRKEVLQNAPYEHREELCSRNLGFILVLASAMPRLKLYKKEFEEVEPGLWKLAVTLTNAGLLPTKVTDKAEAIGIEEVEVRLSLPSSAFLIDGVLVQKLGHLESQGERRVSWLIKAESGSEVVIKASSSRAGKIKHVLHAK